MSKRAIVLGGAGLIGSHLSARLINDGYEVICIDKRNFRESQLHRHLENSSNFHYVKHDVSKPYDISCDELYNFAAPAEYGILFDPIEEQRVAALGAMNSIKALGKNSSRVLYASSDDVYNFDNIDQDYTSTKRYIADSKRFAESIYRANHAENRIDTRIARIYSTYGASSGLRDQHVIGKMVIEALNNQDITIHGNGDQIRTFCWIDDMIDGIIKLMHVHSNEKIVVADLGSGKAITIRHLAELIIELTGSRSNIHHTTALADEAPFKIPNLKVAEDQLYWSAATPLREGLQRTISHIEKELSAISINQMSWIEIYG